MYNCTVVMFPFHCYADTALFPEPKASSVLSSNTHRVIILKCIIQIFNINQFSSLVQHYYPSIIIELWYSAIVDPASPPLILINTHSDHSGFLPEWQLFRNSARDITCNNYLIAVLLYFQLQSPPMVL